MLVWIVFLVFIFILLALDLGVFHRRRARRVGPRGPDVDRHLDRDGPRLRRLRLLRLRHTTGWDWGSSRTPSNRSAAYPDGRVNDARSALVKFLTGYVVELSLSADNVFVIAMLFGYFAIPRMYQHRVLFWGILGALAMRGAMIAIGARLVAEFSWILPVFGALLILTAVKMVFMGEASQRSGEELPRPPDAAVPARDGPLPRRALLRESCRRRALERRRRSRMRRGRRRRGIGGGRWMLTPLMPALVMVETTDLVFAVDSIPAIFAITADPFLVFTSNVFAILGLRSLYFALAGALHLFRYLKHALALVLLTVGVKMLAHTWLERVLGPTSTCTCWRPCSPSSPRVWSCRSSRSGGVTRLVEQ